MHTERIPEIPGYRLLRPLGMGGCASVFVAVQESLNREVAPKLLHGSLGSERHVRRFLREAQVMARLNHPALVRIFHIVSGLAWNRRQRLQCTLLAPLANPLTGPGSSC